eukprot:scaffold122101_cov34-Tisochrysis_lutea.AAC.6
MKDTAPPTSPRTVGLAPATSLDQLTWKRLEIDTPAYSCLWVCQSILEHEPELELQRDSGELTSESHGSNGLNARKV